MLPKIFENNFRDPISAGTRLRWKSPLISALNFTSLEGIDIYVEIITEDSLATDIIYALPQIPANLNAKEVSYAVRIPYIAEGALDLYYSGLFTNSLLCNLQMFTKYDFLYIPCIFTEVLDSINIGYADAEPMPFWGHITHQTHIRKPEEIKGSLIIHEQKYPTEKMVAKQKQMCFRSCIFK